MKKFCESLNKKDSIAANPSHKISAECFTECAKWKLSCTITYNKTSTGLIFQGKSYFFKKLSSSILNQFQILDNVSEISKSTIKNLEEKAFSKENNTSDENLNYSEIKFPLNNSENLLSDGICGITLGNHNDRSSQTNVLFFEFDINSCNISKEHLKCFKEINNNFVDKELHFVLNATIHGKSLFKNEIRFFVEARKFIKSMQFKLENYKSEFVEKQKQIQRSNPNFEIKNSKFNFFTKIVSNEILGIEFNKPNLYVYYFLFPSETVDSYPTNFNSIVNSNITINRIFLEISLPQSLLNPERKSKIQEENCLNSEFEGLMKSYSTFTNLKDMPPVRSGGCDIARGKSDYSITAYNQTVKHSKNVKHSKRGEKSIYESSPYYEGSSYEKGIYYQQTPPLNKFNTASDYDNNNNNNNSKYYTQGNNVKRYYDFTTTSSTYSSNKFISLDKTSISTRKYQTQSSYQKNNNIQWKSQSLQILLANYENMCNFIIFAQNCTPYVHKSDTHLIDDIQLQDFFANFDRISGFGMDVQYIHDSSEVIQVNYSPTLSSLVIIINDLISCDAIIKELNSLRKSSQNSMKFVDLNLNLNLNLNTSQTASNSTDTDQEMGTTWKSSSQCNWSGEFKDFEYQVSENLKITCINEKVKLEYFESKPPHLRSILSEQLLVVTKCLKSIEMLDLSKLDKSSWFCVLWSPMKSSKIQFANTSFMVYYGFSYNDDDIYYRGFSNYMEIPLIGILPVKFEEGVWLKTIRKAPSSSFSHGMNFSSDIDFKLALNDSISNVHDFIFASTDRTSVDYDFYIKSNVVHGAIMTI